MGTNQGTNPGLLPNGLSIETMAIHGGQSPDPAWGAVMQPIVLASTFAQDGPGGHRGFEYSRSGNPTRQALEACLANLEGGNVGLAFASGCAAITAVLHTLTPGDHVVCGDDVYGGTFRIFDKVLKPWGLNASYVDMTDPDEVLRAWTPTTRLAWIETPSNPMLKIFDIAEIARRAHAKSGLVVVDNTFATPILQRPLDLGADVVVHSTTKYINGHSDAVGGAVVTADRPLGASIAFLQNAMGGVPSPFDCYLVLRGIKTLPVRMRQHVESASLLATRLAKHPHVRRVHYPWLPSHAGVEIARRQMRGGSGMITIELDAGLEQARAFLRALRIFVCAESLGGVESLAEHPASMTHASIPAESRRRLGIDDGLIRLSVGLEGIDDLWCDLEEALAASQRV